MVWPFWEDETLTKPPNLRKRPTFEQSSVIVMALESHIISSKLEMFDESCRYDIMFPKDLELVDVHYGKTNTAEATHHLPPLWSRLCFKTIETNIDTQYAREF